MAAVHRLTDFWTYASPFRRAAYVSVSWVVIISGFGLIVLLPKADSSSIQAGLTIIAEILGVLLGAALVVVGLVIEQGHQAEELLRNRVHFYRRRIRRSASVIDSARRQLVELVCRGEIQLEQPLYVGPSGTPSSTTLENVVAALTTLLCVFPEYAAGDKSEQLEKDLEILGYSRDGIINTLYLDSHEADTEPDSFLQLVRDALEPPCIKPALFSQDILDLGFAVLDDYSRDGIDDALRRLERSRSLRGGWTLVGGLIAPALTIVLSVLSIFGVTKETVGGPLVTWIVVVIVVGFVLSVIMALLLVQEILT